MCVSLISQSRVLNRKNYLEREMLKSNQTMQISFHNFIPNKAFIFNHNKTRSLSKRKTISLNHTWKMEKKELDYTLLQIIHTEIAYFIRSWGREKLAKRLNTLKTFTKTHWSVTEALLIRTLPLFYQLGEGTLIFFV